jgi:Flp pilus assembly protein TadD
VLVTMSLGGCQTTGMSDITGSLRSRTAARAEADPRQAVDIYGERYRANPKSVDAALKYGQALRATGQRAQAVAVLEQASLAHPGNKALLALYGRALADNGNFQLAFDVLSRAHTPQNPDWRILSVQGTVLDQLGRHEEARRYYTSALKIVPEEPSVLSNLALSYVLTRNLPQAESILRRAYARPGADARVRQNLALVVGLQGRFAEAETIVKADLPPDEAAANIAYLKQMLNESSRRVGRRAASVASLDQS